MLSGTRYKILHWFTKLLIFQARIISITIISWIFVLRCLKYLGMVVECIFKITKNVMSFCQYKIPLSSPSYFYHSRSMKLVINYLKLWSPFIFKLLPIHLQLQLLHFLRTAKTSIFKDVRMNYIFAIKVFRLQYCIKMLLNISF